MAQLMPDGSLGPSPSIKTNPTEYARQLLRLLTSRPELSISDLAKLLQQKPEWVIERLKLLLEADA